ncbi:hypothetical protein BDA96_04G142100 [Sorghum bicolor]|uniref:AB hydrolase-1 domain-containing protein n=1 Tax=Sorghum bicolor TaxID=4558 RepID=A0A921R419_SORBI|nr:hypothetical protein BDA96_04G142100 [Sorghum bicolor]KAG0532862.1 hypothetical protein BDA96_04G142100 [Sorghum bicolor]
MGSMITSKLAAMAPHRVASLALLNTTGGGYQCIPKVNSKSASQLTSKERKSQQSLQSAVGNDFVSHTHTELKGDKIDWHTISLACRFLRARTPEQRAILDLEVHYTREYLEEVIGTSTRRQMLYQEYVKGLSSGGMQSRYGFEGQINACWTHKLSPTELDRIRFSGFLVLIIHGRDDVVAQLYHARRLAENLQPAAKLVELRGGHLVSHERPAEVNMSLMEMIKASNSNTDLEEWSNLPNKSDGLLLSGSASCLTKRDDDRVNYLVFTYNLLGKLQLIFLFVFGVFYVILEHVRRVVKILKPVRVSASTL